MYKQTIFSLILLLAGMTFGHAAPDNNNTSDNNNTITPLRIMPLGDSITQGMKEFGNLDQENIGGYRRFLWKMLKDANHSVDFVGSERAGESIRPSIDPDNEGHPGWRMSDINNIAYSATMQHLPDMILLHTGTNDLGVVNSDGIKQILDQVAMYEQHSGKKTIVLVALIIDHQVHNSRIDKFNKNVKKYLQKRILSGDRIRIVDMYNDAKLTAADYTNEMHPNDTGYYKMAEVWFRSIIMPYNHNLRLFPTTLIGNQDIESLVFNDRENTVTFKTKIPNTGIVF